MACDRRAIASSCCAVGVPKNTRSDSASEDRSPVSSEASSDDIPALEFVPSESAWLGLAERLDEGMEGGTKEDLSGEVRIGWEVGPGGERQKLA
jgi:hypothetical protein